MTWLLTLFACLATAPAAPAGTPLAYVEHTPSAGLPLVVVIHGMGARPENMRDSIASCHLPVRVVAPRAPTPQGEGFTWFARKFAEDGTRIWDVDAMRARADDLAATIRAESPTGKAVVTGFSQGGILSFVLASTHPEVVVAAVPVAGMLPPALEVPAGPGAPKIRALHGEADETIPAPPTVALIGRLKAGGWDASIETFPGIQHQVSSGVHAAWCAAIAEATAKP